MLWGNDERPRRIERIEEVLKRESKEDAVAAHTLYSPLSEQLLFIQEWSQGFGISPRIPKVIEMQDLLVELSEA